MRNDKLKKSLKKIVLTLFLCLLSVFYLLSCGIEAFYYIHYVSDGEYWDVTGACASIHLPSSSEDGYSAPNNYFNNFIIFYRIYISNEQPGSAIITSELRTLINSTLNSDFNSLYSLTDKNSTSVTTSNLETRFNTQKYFMLTLENADINTVLGSNSLGKTLEFHFPPNTGENPFFRFSEPSSTNYIFQRANMGPGLNFTPRPDRYFLNHPDLYNTSNVSNEINADTAINSKSDLRYTYVSMYIVALGTSHEMPPKSIYSQPTFIGIFKLAEAN